MEKGKIRFWILVLLAFIPNFLFASSVTIKTVGKAQYVSLEVLKQKFPELEVLEKPAVLITEIRGNGKRIRVRSGSSFYALNDKIIKIPIKVIYSKQQMFLPPDVVEAILMNLVTVEVFYQYQKDSLVMEVRSSDAGIGFLPIRAVVIDAGHGGKDPGTSDKKGNKEKTIALNVALALEKALKKEYPEMIVYLTRNNDRFIPLEDRSQLANNLLKDTKEAVFISIHCNASLSPMPSGYEIYYLSQTPTTEQERETSIRENKIIDSKYPAPIPSIQAGMLSNVVQRRSKLIADKLDVEFQKGIGSLIPSRGVKKANFSVLRGSLMPAVLIEMGYLSHPKEAIYLNSVKVQGRIVNSIVKGIKAYGEGKD
ncbi:MAG: N-acetylmuramoyl-L-alanine amidase [Leptospira sp.]|nr:N-acetylmuramoyl-L-alanine amidase [Leptospira sp.]